MMAESTTVTVSTTSAARTLNEVHAAAQNAKRYASLAHDVAEAAMKTLVEGGTPRDESHFASQYDEARQTLANKVRAAREVDGITTEDITLAVSTPCFYLAVAA